MYLSSRRYHVLWVNATSRPAIAEVSTLVIVDDYSGFTELLGEHGLSMLVSIKYDNNAASYNILFDTGRSSRVLLNNSRALNVNFTEIDTIVLSHRHYDHTGGLPGIVNKLRGKTIIAHPDILKTCYAEVKGFAKFSVGLTVETRKALHEFELTLVRSPLELAPDVWFLGEIYRHYDNGYAVKVYRTLIDGKIVEEQMLDDTGLAIKLGDLALVIAGCSHSGAQNIARQAKKITGTSNVIIVGGLHLASASEEDLERAVKELLEEGLIEAHVGHCTGLLGEAKLLEKLSKKLHKIHSGYKVTIKAK